MARGIFFFLLVWALSAAALSTWRRWSGRGAWHAAKLAGFASLSAVAALAVVAFIVIFFQ